MIQQSPEIINESLKDTIPKNKSSESNNNSSNVNNEQLPSKNLRNYYLLHLTRNSNQTTNSTIQLISKTSANDENTMSNLSQQHITITDPDNNNISTSGAPEVAHSPQKSSYSSNLLRPVQRRRIRRKPASSLDDKAEHLTEMSVRGLDLFRYASITEGVYQCIECAKENIQRTFKNKYSFQRHAFLYHEGKHRKVFPCPQCGKEFSRPDKMKNHMKTTHEGSIAKETTYNPFNYLMTSTTTGSNTNNDIQQIFGKVENNSTTLNVINQKNNNNNNNTKNTHNNDNNNDNNFYNNENDDTIKDKNAKESNDQSDIVLTEEEITKNKCYVKTPKTSPITQNTISSLSSLTSSSSSSSTGTVSLTITGISKPPPLEKIKIKTEIQKYEVCSTPSPQLSPSRSRSVSPECSVVDITTNKIPMVQLASLTANLAQINTFKEEEVK